MSAVATQSSQINGIDTTKIHQLVEAIGLNPAKALTRWSACSRWKGGFVSEASITACEVSGKRVARNFKLTVDEPLELAGTNTSMNPQEVILAALNACMTVGYVAGCSLNGITLESLEIESSGEIDLRGFLGLDSSVKPGYDRVHYTVRIKGNGTPEQFEKIHQTVIATSPNRFNFSNPIKMTSDLIVD